MCFCSDEPISHPQPSPKESQQMLVLYSHEGTQGSYKNVQLPPLKWLKCWSGETNKADQMNTHTLCTTQWGSLKDSPPPINSCPTQSAGQPQEQGQPRQPHCDPEPTEYRTTSTESWANWSTENHESQIDPVSLQSTGQLPQSPEPIGLQKIMSPKLTQYLYRSLTHPCWPMPQPDQKSHCHRHNQPIHQSKQQPTGIHVICSEA